MNLDDRLLAEAHELTGIAERAALIHEGLHALIERESARRLVRLAGDAPAMKPVPRRRAPGCCRCRFEPGTGGGGFAPPGVVSPPPPITPG